MTVSLNNDYNCDELIARIEKLRKVNAEGTVSFTGGFEYFQYVTVLYSMLIFSENIPEAEKRGLIWQAIKASGEKGTITKKGLLAEINKLSNLYLEKPLVHYVLVTTLSIRSATKLHTIKFRGTTIVFGARLNKTFKESRSKVEFLSKPSVRVKIPDNYIFVKINVLARSIYEAADQALNSLDFVRGTWNWWYNRGAQRISFGNEKPVNNILLGPLHTLHFPNGEIVTETWWYESKQLSNIGPYEATKDISNLYKFLRDIRIKLAKCTYQQDIEDAIILYSRALDDWDWPGAFLKLWSVLEQLTDSHGNYKSTIQRASFLFIERNYCQQVLRHLKDYRNKFVHEAADSSEIETYLYQLKTFVEHLLIFHLGNKFGFESIKEASEFLDLPSDKNELSSEKNKLLSRLDMIEYAQKYLKHV